MPTRDPAQRRSISSWPHSLRVACALVLAAATFTATAGAAAAVVPKPIPSVEAEAGHSAPHTPKPDLTLTAPERILKDRAVASPLSVRSDAYAAEVFDLMNAKRRAAGVPALAWNQTIADGSQAWAQHLGVATASSSFDWAYIHRPDAGRSIIPAGAHWYSEIIAFNFSAASIVNWWMNSPAHRAAMLDPRETHVGIGYVVPTSGPYQGWHMVVSNLAGYTKASAPPPASAPPSPFADLIFGQQFLADMNWMHQKGISTGWTEADGSRTYRPLLPVKRDAMAAFMYRLSGSPAYKPPAVSPFADVPVSSPFYKEISWLAEAKISTGWAQQDGRSEFRPMESVNRDAMAAFLYRLAGSPRHIPSANSAFTDVSSGNQFHHEISWLAASGISTGWKASNGTAVFLPGESVARDAMAAFMKRWQG